MRSSVTDKPFGTSAMNVSLNGFNYPSGSKSASASPGPMRAFRQNYSAFDASATGVPPALNQHTMLWLDNYNFVPDSNLSRTPSIMSTQSSMASLATNMSELSVITDDSIHTTRNYFSPDMYQQGTPVNYENYNPDIHSKLISFINELRQGNEQPIDEIKSLVKFRHFEYVTDGRLFVDFIYALLNVMYCQKMNEMVVMKILSILYYMLQTSKPGTGSQHSNTFSFTIEALRSTEGSFALLLYEFLSPEKEYCKFAITIMHTLLYSGRDRFTRAVVRQKIIFVDVYSDLICKMYKSSLTVSLDTLKIIISGHSELKQKFYLNGGLQIILNYLANETEERILYHAATVLDPLLCDYKKEGNVVDKFIEIDGIEICSKHLGHPSSRLLEQIMICLAHVGSAHTIAMKNLQDPANRVLQLLGSTHHKLVNIALHFLANIMNVDHQNKVHLVRGNAVEYYLRMLAYLQPARFSSRSEDKKMYEDMMENCLWGLQSMCLKYNPPVDDFSKCVCEKISQFQNWGLMLLEIIRRDVIGSCNRALLILYTVVMNAPQYALPFLENFKDEKGFTIHHYAHFKVQQALDLLFDPSLDWAKTGLFPLVERTTKRQRNGMPLVHHDPKILEKNVDLVRVFLSRSLKFCRIIASATRDPTIMRQLFESNSCNPFFIDELFLNPQYQNVFEELVMLAPFVFNWNIACHWTSSIHISQKIRHIVYNGGYAGGLREASKRCLQLMDSVSAPPVLPIHSYQQ